MAQAACVEMARLRNPDRMKARTLSVETHRVERGGGEERGRRGRGERRGEGGRGEGKGGEKRGRERRGEEGTPHERQRHNTFKYSGLLQ